MTRQQATGNNGQPPPPPLAPDDPWRGAPAGARLSPRPTLPGVTFDHAAADYAVDYFTHYVRFSQGPKVGEPFVLEPWQAWGIRQVFGWQRPNGTRLYRRWFLWVPRGNGKTELLAGVSHIALTAMSQPGEGSEVYSIGANESQAKIVHGAAVKMVGHSAELSARYELRKGSIYCPETDAVFKPLTGKAVGKHGLRCRVLIGDEAHEWKTGDLHTYVRDSMVKWPDPLEIIISTAGKPEGHGWELWNECCQIADGTVDDDETLVMIFAAEPGDDLADPDVQRRVNPNLGVSIAPDVFAGKVKRALRLPYLLTDLKRYHFNIWSEDDARWIPPVEWARCTTTPEDRERWRQLEAECRGRKCWGGLDLASTRDTNALVWLFPPDEEHPRWIILPRIWWPREQALAHKAGARIPVERWEHEGALILTPGNTADHQAIKARVLDDCALFQVQGLGVDPFNSHQITLDLAQDGVPVVIVKNNMASLSVPSKTFERRCLEAEYEHGNQPVLRWQVGCAAVRTDDQENIMPSKKRSSGKIDTVAATVMAEALAATQPQTTYLASSPLIVLPI